jgi:hypothetical protein
MRALAGNSTPSGDRLLRLFPDTTQRDRVLVVFSALPDSQRIALLDGDDEALTSALTLLVAESASGNCASRFVTA